MIERIAFILLCNLLFFFKTLGYKYSSDDIPASQRPKEKNKWRNLLSVINSNARSTPQKDHALTTIIHTLVCVFIYIGFGANDISFLASFLFAFNPANNQGSVWIAGRSYALPALGMVLAISIPVLGPLLIIAIAYFNAGFIAPLAFIGHNQWLLLFLPVAWAIHGKRFYNNVSAKVKVEMFEEDKKIHPKKLILATKTFGFYFIHALLPIKTAFYHSFLQSLAGSMSHKGYTFCRYFWIGVIALGSIAWYMLTHQWNMTCFGLLWWCICISPFLNIIRIHQEIAERYIYLPNVGLMFALASVLINFPILASAFISAYAVRMWFYMEAYKDDYFLSEHSRFNSPDSWFAWHVAGMKRWDAGSRLEAMILWTMAKMISPKEFKILYNISTALKLIKQDKEADEFLEEATKHIPKGQEKEVGEIIENAKNGKVTIIL